MTFTTAYKPLKPLSRVYYATIVKEYGTRNINLVFAHTKHMDDRYEEEYDFKRTIREAADLDSDIRALERARKLDAEIAYETLAVNASMGMYGTDDTVANLMQLGMAEELLYKLKLNEGDAPEYND